MEIKNIVNFEYLNKEKLLTFFRGNKKTNLPSIFLGVFLGYSNESIVAFLDRDKKLDKLNIKYDPNFREDMLPIDTGTSYGTIFYNSGFIPSNKEKSKKPEIIIKEINERRFYKRKFESKDKKQKFTYKMIDKEIKNNDLYVLECNKTIEYILKNNKDLLDNICLN